MVPYMVPMVLAVAASGVAPHGSQREEISTKSAISPPMQQKEFNKDAQDTLLEAQAKLSNKAPIRAHAYNREQMSVQTADLSALHDSSESSSPLLRRETGQPLPASLVEVGSQGAGYFHGGPLDGMAMPSGLYGSGDVLVQRGGSWVRTPGPPGPHGKPGRSTLGPPGPPGRKGPPGTKSERAWSPPHKWHVGHWRWDPEIGGESYQPDGGAEQGDFDPRSRHIHRHMGEPNPWLVKKAGEIMGPVAYLSPGNPMGNMQAIEDAVEKTGEWKRDPLTGQLAYTPVVKQTPEFAKMYHDRWVSPQSHGASAYEPDYLHDNSEFFGPFVIDYKEHNVELPDWNFVVRSENKKPGRGNLGVGLENFFYDATNSFIAGRHNIVRGEYDAVFGGQDNAAEGNFAAVKGGQRNIAFGDGAVNVGGYRNEAEGESSTVIGGKLNVAKGKYSAVTGGIDNQAVGDFSLVGGGKGNQAEGAGSAVGGGEGNKAAGEGAIVTGGFGGHMEDRFKVHEGQVPKSLSEDELEEQEQDEESEKEKEEKNEVFEEPSEELHHETMALLPP